MNPSSLLANGAHMFSKAISRLMIQGLIFICCFSSMFRGCAETLNEYSQHRDSNTATLLVAGTFDVHFDASMEFHNFKMEPEFHECIK